MNKTLMNTLKYHTTRRHQDWEKMLPLALAAYNSSVHSSTGHSPYYLNHARDLRLPVDALLLPPPRCSSLSEYSRNITLAMQEVWEDTRRKIAESQAVQKAQHDKKAFNRDIQPGDLVALKIHKVPPGKWKKLHETYQFPFLVVRVQWPNLLVKPMGTPDDRRVHTVHVNNVRQYFGPWTHPTLGSIPYPSVAQQVDPTDIYCKHCKAPLHMEDLGRRSYHWVQCDDCQEWVHCVCEGMPNRKVRQKYWYCMDCRADPEGATHQIASLVMDTFGLADNKVVPSSDPSPVSHN